MMDKTARSTARLSIITIPVVLGIGFLMGILSNSGLGNAWFDNLAKPALMPPGWVFGVAWTILYVLLGISLALALASPRSPKRRLAVGLFLIQLALNFSWSPLFFGAHQVRAALVVIVLILVLSVGAAIALRRVRAAAAWLFVPYVAWLCFATYLNLEIILLNPGL